MARTRRNTVLSTEIAPQVPKERFFKTGIYARLSVENSGKSEEKDAICNQIAICKSYIEEYPNLQLVDTYIDNGISGTVFNRPEFNRLMEDIRTRKIDSLIVRDLSRFGRDYIETATYIERIFPELGVMFISVKENFNSFETNLTNESLMI